MKEKEFCLLEEPWIRVLRQDCTVEEVSLVDALVRAHTFRALAGELPTQDAAMLRMLLAVLYAVFARTREVGGAEPLADADDALQRWQTLWEGGRFPEQPIRAYLGAYRERFYLFHPERPFWQAKAAEVGTYFKAAKLNGVIAESGNKYRLFAGRAGEAKEVLTYAEAARWLLHLNGYDDTSAKPKQKGLPSPGAGWLGKLGLVWAEGDNLFETLMLNFVMVDDNEELWDENCPVWELDAPPEQERREIALPQSQMQLLTLQSRRLLLQRDARGVTGVTLLGGDFFDRKNAFSEQMTVWAHIDAKGKAADYWQPRRHDPQKQIWREFASIASAEAPKGKPGVVRWRELLEYNGMLQRNLLVRLRIAGVKYGDKDFFIKDIFSDSIQFHTALLAEIGREWNRRVQAEVALADRAAGIVAQLGRNLDSANGHANGALADFAKMQFYYRIDIPFRRFLEKIDPQADYEGKAVWREEWREAERRIALALGEELIGEALPTAFLGREQDGRRYSLPEAYNQFQYQIKQLLG